MKQRVTYLLPEGNAVDLQDITIGSRGLTYSNIDQASAEWRLNLGLSELTEELKLILETCHEVHARFVRPQNHQLVPPLVSRLSSGLHLQWTPENVTQDVTFRYLIGRLLGEGVICSSTIETCTELPIVAERSAEAVSYQYYRFAEDQRSKFVDTFLDGICLGNPLTSPLYHSCWDSLRELAGAGTLDVDYTSDGSILTLKALWGKGEIKKGGAGPHGFHSELAEGDRLEVGVLESQRGKRTGEFSLGGYLTVVGEDDRPKPTYFSFASRHHSLLNASATTFTTSFQQPTGLHPKLQIKLSRQKLVPPKDTCSLHAYVTLPSTLFIDRYQLSDRLFLDSQNLIALSNLIGEQDLEAPDWVVKRWGSTALLQLAVPPSQALDSGRDWIVTVPMHLRYINGPRSAKDGASEANVKVPWPVVFWACQAEEGARLSNNPFDRTKLGYDDLFESNTVFYHIPPATTVKSTVLDIKVPMLSEQTGGMVQAGTLLAVGLGFFWICRQLLSAARPKVREVGRDQKQK